MEDQFIRDAELLIANNRGKNLLRRCKAYIEPQAHLWTDTEKLLKEINEVLEE